MFNEEKIKIEKEGSHKIFSPGLRTVPLSPRSKLRWLFLALGLFALIAVTFFLVRNYRDRKNQERSQDYSYEALVQVVDQTSDDPVMDRRLNLKKGDVLVVFPKGHEWAETERKSYLILKLKISEEEAAKLAEADVRVMATGEENTPATMQFVRMRAYRIKTESLNFDPNNLTEKQPFWDKVYDWGMVEEKPDVKIEN